MDSGELSPLIQSLLSYEYFRDAEFFNLFVAFAAVDKKNENCGQSRLVCSGVHRFQKGRKFGYVKNIMYKV